MYKNILFMRSVLNIMKLQKVTGRFLTSSQAAKPTTLPTPTNSTKEHFQETKNAAFLTDYETATTGF